MDKNVTTVNGEKYYYDWLNMKISYVSVFFCCKIVYFGSNWMVNDLWINGWVGRCLSSILIRLENKHSIK